jgi:hypothetical protein
MLSAFLNVLSEFRFFRVCYAGLNRLAIFENAVPHMGDGSAFLILDEKPFIEMSDRPAATAAFWIPERLLDLISGRERFDCSGWNPLPGCHIYLRSKIRQLLRFAIGGT